MTDTCDCATLARIEGKLDALRRDVAELFAARRRGKLSPGDVARLAALVPAIVDAAGASVWTTAAVAALAVLPGRAELAAAMAPLVCGRGGLRSLGKLLGRAARAGHDVGGCRVVQVGAERDGALWTVQRV